MIGADHTGVVFHIGAKGSIENVSRELNDMEIKVPTYNENCAGEGSKLGKNMDELRKLIEGTDSYNVGVCIDTCHAFAAGMSDLREMSATEKLFEDLSLFNDRPIIFHVNDSLTEFSGKSDRHAPIAFGHIWNLNRENSLDPLKRFYELANSSSYDIIFETPNPMTIKYESEMVLMD
jgi:endonuclease IV